MIDEFHHAMAPTYRRLIAHLQPQQLLGLTATPERGDGVDVAQQFFEGRTASELRLWDALDADLLVPFHYFGVSDDVDLSQVEWKCGNDDTSQLSKLYTGNDARAAKVIRGACAPGITEVLDSAPERLTKVREDILARKQALSAARKVAQAQEETRVQAVQARRARKLEHEIDPQKVWLVIAGIMVIAGASLWRLQGSPVVQA